jgi:hypothetical protein
MADRGGLRGRLRVEGSLQRRFFESARFPLTAPPPQSTLQGCGLPGPRAAVPSHGDPMRTRLSIGGVLGSLLCVTAAYGAALAAGSAVQESARPEVSGIRLMDSRSLAETAGMQAGPGETNCGTYTVAAGQGCVGVGFLACPTVQSGCNASVCRPDGCEPIPNVWVTGPGGVATNNIKGKSCSAFARVRRWQCEWDNAAGLCKCNKQSPLTSIPCPEGSYWGSCTGTP